MGKLIQFPRRTSILPPTCADVVKEIHYLEQKTVIQGHLPLVVEVDLDQTTMAKIWSFMRAAQKKSSPNFLTYSDAIIKMIEVAALADAIDRDWGKRS